MRDVVDQIHRIGTPEELAQWRDDHSISPDLVLALVAEVRSLRERRAIDSALLLSEWSVLLADGLSDPVPKGRAMVSRAVTRVRKGDHASALADLCEALAIFERAGETLWAANVRVNRVISYSHLARYNEALQEAEIANAALEKLADKRSLAINCANTAQVLYQRDRLCDAVAMLKKSEELLLGTGDRKTLAGVYLNHSAVLAGLNRVSDALGYCTRSSEIAAETGDRDLAATCQHNLAYLHYLRGEYAAALNLLHEARSALTMDQCERAFCDLAQSEICLELNLGRDAMRYAEAACRAFKDVPRPFEIAKSITVMGAASSQLQEFERAARLFTQARKMFDEQGNPVRAAIVDLHEAWMCMRTGRYSEARRLARASSAVFLSSGVKQKAVLAEIVSMTAGLKLSDFEGASRDAAEAAALYSQSPTPWAGLQLHAAMGELHMERDRFEEARSELRKAIAESERLCSNIGADELRMSFSRDKLPVYELLVQVSLRSGERVHRREAFEILDRAKSRVLADRLTARKFGPDHQAWSPVEDIQRSIPDGAVLIEYFVHGDDLGAFCVTAAEFEMVERLTSWKAARRCFEFLQYQLTPARGRTGRAFHAKGHLYELYRMLVGPLEGFLKDRASLVFVPCDFLHSMPLHALFDGERYLTDRFQICYAPSAHLYRLLSGGTVEAEAAPLVVGVNGSRTPRVREEVEAIRSALPNAKTLVGQEATVDRVVEEIQRASLIHIAGHAVFRPDQAMFSAMELHDGPLNCFDLQELRTRAALVTLSGCGTGLTRVARGDEPLGLVRGFLYAGAASAVMSLWDVHDGVTAELMTEFYRSLAGGRPAAESLRLAMILVREEHPHPYYWAPFLLLGGGRCPEKIV